MSQEQLQTRWRTQGPADAGTDQRVDTAAGRSATRLARSTARSQTQRPSPCHSLNPSVALIVAMTRTGDDLTPLPRSNAGVAFLLFTVAGLGHVLLWPTKSLHHGQTPKKSIPLEYALAIGSLAVISLASYSLSGLQMTSCCQVSKPFARSRAR